MYARACVHVCVSVCVSKIQVLADYGENACYSKYGDYRDVDIPLEDLLHEYGASVDLTLLKKQIGPNESNEKDRQTNRQADTVAVRGVQISAFVLGGIGRSALRLPGLVHRRDSQIVTLTQHQPY